MPSTRSTAGNSESSHGFSLPISPDVLLSVGTPILLLGLVGAQTLTRVFREVGDLSEEVFRSDRLPLLNIPITSPTTTESKN